MYIRPIRLSDHDLYRSILERITPEDCHCRFFHAVTHIDPNEVRRFVEPSKSLFGLIAMDGDTPLGAAHACFNDDGSAELAVVVANDARHQSVGQTLVCELVATLTERGCPRLIALAYWDNSPMTRIAEHLGMKLVERDRNIVTWSLDLGARAAA